jgi:hypothetical protein
VIRAILRHSSVEVTREIYSKPANSDAVAAMPDSEA